MQLILYNNVVFHTEPAAQIAHLVFADTQANTKNQKSNFLPTLKKTEEHK